MPLLLHRGVHTAKHTVEGQVTRDVFMLTWCHCNLHYGRQRPLIVYTWWRHQMETFSALLALCEGRLKKMLSCPYGESHCGNKTILRRSYLQNGISYIGKITLLLNQCPKRELSAHFVLMQADSRLHGPVDAWLSTGSWVASLSRSLDSIQTSLDCGT